jgi:hypothetical protein
MPKRQPAVATTDPIFEDESSPNCPGYPGVCGSFCSKNESRHIGHPELLPCGTPK